MNDENEIIEPETNQEQQTQDLDVMETTPNIAEDVPQSDPLAGLSMGIIKGARKMIKNNVVTTDDEVKKFKTMADMYGFNTPAHIKTKELKEQKQMDELSENIKKEKIKADETIIKMQTQNKPQDGFDVSLNASDINTFVGEPEIDAKRLLSQTALDPDNSWEMNYNTLAETNDIKMLIANQANGMKVEVDEARRGKISHDSLIQMSRIIGKNPDELQKILSREDGEILSPEYLLASKNLLVDSSNRLYALSSLVKGGSDKDILAFMKQNHFHKQLFKSFMGLRAEYGRGLNAMKITQGSQDFEAKQMSEMIMDSKIGANPEALADAILNTGGDASKIGKLQKSVFARTLDGIHSLRVGSMLSGPSTIAYNALAIPVQTGLHYVDLINASLMGFTNKTGNALDTITLRDLRATVSGEMHSIMSSLDVAFKTLKTGEEYGMGSKMEDRQYDDVLKSEQLFNTQNVTLATRAWDRSVDVAQFMVKNVMGSTDSFAKHFTEQGELYRIAFKRTEDIAIKENLSTDEAQKLLKYMMEVPSEEMINESVEMGRRVAFQERNSKGFEASMQAVFGNRLMRNVSVFRRTPVNVLRQSFIDRSPLSLISKKNKEAYAKGGEQRQMVLGRIATGAELFAGISAMIGSDFITGGLPNSPEERELWKQQGKKPYSITMGGTHYSYAKIEPISNIFGLVAGIKQSMDELDQYHLTDEEEKGFTEYLGAGVMAIAEQTLNKTFMQSVKQVVDLFDKQSHNNSKYFWESFAASMVPLSGMNRNLKYMIDDTAVKVSDDMLESILKNVPFLNSDLTKKRGFYGEEITKEQYANPVKFYEALDTKNDKVIQRALYLQKETSTNFMSMPTRSKDGIKLLPSEYNKYVLFSRNNLKLRVSGRWKDFKKYLHDVVTDKKLLKFSPNIQNDKISQAIHKWDNGAYMYFIGDNKKLRDRKLVRKAESGIYEYAKKNNITNKESKEKMLKSFKNKESLKYERDVRSKKYDKWKVKK